MTRDARLQEMQFLSLLDREGKIDLACNEINADSAMVLSLLHDGYINDIDSLIWSGGEAFAGEFNQLRQEFEKKRWREIGYLLHRAKHALTLRISHKGRVRLSELKQDMKSGRDRDATGLLWDKRHVKTDLSIAILDASPESPLAVVFVDMNGLKAINDTLGHTAGDEAIKTFFEAVMTTLGERGEAVVMRLWP
jgi:hypothetical protein